MNYITCCMKKLNSSERLKKHKSHCWRNDSSWREESCRRVACYLRSNMEGRERTKSWGMGKVNHHHNTEERRPVSIQQLQNNCAPMPRGQDTDAGVIGEAENTDVNAFIRGTSRMQERQKCSTPDLDSEATCRGGKTKGAAHFQLLSTLSSLSS